MLARLKREKGSGYLSYDQFETYLLDRTGCTMTEMARELGMSVPEFRAYTTTSWPITT